MARMSLKRFYAVLTARNNEFIRDRSALSWNILFPALIVAGFAFAFSGKPLDQFKVGVFAAHAEQRLADVKQQPGFFQTRLL